MPYERAFERIREAYPGNRLFTMMLDGNSISSMWESSGLESPDVLFEKSFAWFQKNCLEVETITVQAYAKTLRRSSLVYLSSCASRRFMTYKGRAESASAGTCAAEPARQVILSDRASKHLYDKMCYVHNLLVLLRGDKARKKSAQEDLWSAQSGDACWKGCAGGIHRPEVRFNSFRALVDAERSSRIHGSFSPGIVMDDMDCDGAREILYQAADMNCYIHERGASVIELDSFKNRCNYFASFPRESHDVYGGFLDEFHETGTFGARVLNLADQTFLLQEKDRGTQKVTFSKDFSLRQGAGTHQMSVRKSYTFQKHLVSVDIELTNRSNNPLSFRYVSCSVLQMSPELDNLVFSTQKGHDKVDLARQSLTEDLLAEALSINASGYREFLEFRSDKTFHLQMVHALGKACTPFGASGEDASPEESHTAATEVFYQGSTLRFGWDINLDADAFISLSLTLHLRT